MISKSHVVNFNLTCLWINSTMNLTKTIQKFSKITKYMLNDNYYDFCIFVLVLNHLSELK